MIEHQIEKSKRGVVAVVSVVLVVGVVVFVGAVVISTDFVGVVIFCFILVVSVMTFVLFFGSCYSCPKTVLVKRGRHRTRGSCLKVIEDEDEGTDECIMYISGDS